MTSALMGVACGMLAAAAFVGMAGQTRANRAALQRGAQAAGVLGTLLLWLACAALGAQAAALPSFLNATGRALSVAGVGLLVTWLPNLRSRQLTAPVDAGLWGCLGLAALLAGWAEFVPADSAMSGTPTLAVLAEISLLIASGLTVPACGQAMAAVRPGHTDNAPPTSLPAGLQWVIAIGIVLAALLASSLQHFFTVGTFWPDTARFKAIAGAWLILFSSVLLRDRAASPWLVILGTLALMGVVLLG